MGSCASVDRSRVKYPVKLDRSFFSKKDTLFVVPFKDKHLSVDSPKKTFDSNGSKEETFFDSQAWLESDCEDDYFSVNGDFTPSRGNTPVHYSTSSRNVAMGISVQVKKTLLEEKLPRAVTNPSPEDKKKRLSDLFQDNVGEKQDIDVNELRSSTSINQQNSETAKKERKIAVIDVLRKTGNGGKSLKIDSHVDGSKGIKHKTKRCLPTLSSCGSYKEWRKMTIPSVATNGKA